MNRRTKPSFSQSIRFPPHVPWCCASITAGSNTVSSLNERILWKLEFRSFCGWILIINRRSLRLVTKGVRVRFMSSAGNYTLSLFWHKPATLSFNSHNETPKQLQFLTADPSNEPIRHFFSLRESMVSLSVTWDFLNRFSGQASTVRLRHSKYRQDHVLVEKESLDSSSRRVAHPADVMEWISCWNKTRSVL